MGKGQPAPTGEQRDPHQEQDDATAGGKGLWSVMGEGEARQSTALSDDEMVVDEAQTPAAQPPSRPPELTRTRLPGAANTRRSLVFGVLALLLAALGLIPELWAQLPAFVAGLAALLLGFMALGEIRSARDRRRSLTGAALGMLLGTCGMLLAPTLFHSLGTSLKQSNDREETRSDLKTIGKGLEGFHEQNGSFPPGGIHRETEEGKRLPLHGWMTTLLPYIGKADLYRKIDLERPYDARANRGPMSRLVPAFQGPGLDPRRSPRGLGLASYSGLGGEFIDDEYGYRSVGIFDRNSRVRREDVVDGLSQTMVAGEVAANLPEWGDPANWRSIGTGLNNDPSGFGNASGTGAHFLMADGSVKFFSNSTDLKVLKALSTRDGREK